MPEEIYTKIVQLDENDPIAHTRAKFLLDDDLIYMDGNSLGPLSHAARKATQSALDDEWGKMLVGGWTEADWLHLCRRTGHRIAPLIGAAGDEVIIADSTSVNIFKLAAAALKLNPQRKTIVTERGNFPTDTYMLEGLARHLGRDITVRLLDRDAIEAALDDDTALLVLTHVHYITAETFDLAHLTELAHDAGALVLWDLSHSTGAVHVDMEAVNADMAVGCGYKYLNGGPGAPSFAYVRRDLQDKIDTPLPGWLGHRAPFDFTDDYIPALGIDRLRVGTPPILSLSALHGALDIFGAVPTEQLWQKSQALSQLFLERVEAAELPGITLLSPRDPSERGSHLSFGHQHGYAIVQNLIDRKVVGDFREPNAIRLAFTPLYQRFADIAKAADVFIDVVRSGTFRQDQYTCRKAVT